MRHLHAAMLCGVFRVSVYDVKDVCWKIRMCEIFVGEEK